MTLAEKNRRLRAVLRKVETVMMIVEPRSHKAEYLATLKFVRDALGHKQPEPRNG